MSTPAQQFAEFVHGLRYSDIPSEVRAATVHKGLIDSIGVGVATQKMPHSRVVTEIVTEWGGVKESTIFGSDVRVPAPNACIANGNMIHQVDYDNTHGPGLMHPCACTVPAALAMTEKVGAGGEDLITALVAGNEVQGRVAAAGAGEFHARGFHPSIVTGSFSTAMVAGKLLGLTEEQLTNALGICGTQASGSFEWLTDGSSAKRFGPGWSGHSGTIAAMMAQRGYTGPKTIFEGRFGLYKSHVEGKYKPERLLRGLGSEWETLSIMTKRYPCCHATHSAINAAKALKRQHGFGPEDVADVEVLVQPDMIPVVGEPQEGKRAPRNVFEAQFSIYYEVAVALVRGNVTLDDFVEERLNDPAVLALAHKVRYTPNEAMRLNPGFPETVIVRLRDGQVLRESDPGDVERPMNAADVEEKFLTNARRNMSAQAAERLLDGLRNVASTTDIRGLMALTVS